MISLSFSIQAIQISVVLEFRGQHTTSRYKHSIQIAYCCVTNHSQLNRLKQLQLFILLLTVIWADCPRGDNALFHVMSRKQLNRAKHIHFEDNSITRLGRCMLAVPGELSGCEGGSLTLIPMGLSTLHLHLDFIFCRVVACF